MGEFDNLPAVPGGWTRRTYSFAGHHLTLTLPRDPDQFLDDEGVIAANEQNDYMPYWAFLWPSSIKMAAALFEAPWPAGQRVLELGAGLGLVGLAAMQRGDVVTLSDYDETALDLCRHNARENGLPVPETLLLDWREPQDIPFDVIIGCEVTYDGPTHGVILDLLEQMLAPQGICWLGDPGRYRSRFFYEMAVERGFQIRILNEELACIPQPSATEFQIFEIRHPEAG